MVQRKGIRSDGTRQISTDRTDNPKLFARLLDDNRESLYLEYYNGYRKVYDEAKDKAVIKVDRHKRTLKLYLWQRPQTPIERQWNKETLELAKKIRFEESQRHLENTMGYRLRGDRSTDFLSYLQNYVDSYTKKDKGMMKVACRRFVGFLEETPEYTKYKSGITPTQVDAEMMEVFAEYLQTKSRGEGAKSIFARFKKIIKSAVEHGVMFQNPCTGISIKVDTQLLRKDVLTLEEEQRLMETHFIGENAEIRRAFILCLYCGVRFCDVKSLTFGNVDYSNRLLKFEQAKVKGRSSCSGVEIPLTDSLLKLIGQPTETESRDSLLFVLPSYLTCIHHLQKWTKAAGIEKHITWHCARHSFAVNILNNGANIKTLASLLGHSSIKQTEKYTRAVDRLKQAAISSLPEIKI